MHPAEKRTFTLYGADVQLLEEALRHLASNHPLRLEACLRVAIRLEAQDTKRALEKLREYYIKIQPQLLGL